MVDIWLSNKSSMAGYWEESVNSSEFTAEISSSWTVSDFRLFVLIYGENADAVSPLLVGSWVL